MVYQGGMIILIGCTIGMVIDPISNLLMIIATTCTQISRASTMRYKIFFANFCDRREQKIEKITMVVMMFK